MVEEIDKPKESSGMCKNKEDINNIEENGAKESSDISKNKEDINNIEENGAKDDNFITESSKNIKEDIKFAIPRQFAIPSNPMKKIKTVDPLKEIKTVDPLKETASDYKNIKFAIPSCSVIEKASIETPKETSSGLNYSVEFEKPSSPTTIDEKTKTDTETKLKIKSKKSDIPYKEPPWGGTPDSSKRYFLTVLKEGIIKNNIPLVDQSLITFGRVEDCDVQIDHPSCSRYHAIIQYCVVEKDIRKLGYYLFDLGSTHGTYLNKEKLKSKVYTRLRVGYQIKFGGSSRIYIVEGPPDDQEEEADLDVLREKKRQYLAQTAENKQKTKQTTTSSTSSTSDVEADEGASWGFGEDAVEEHLNLQELFEKKKNIEVKDAKKTLRNFFEKEGLELEYEMTERGSSFNIIHVAKVRLPIETGDGDEVVAEASSSNKKEAVLACATDACRLIQAYDMMQNKCKEDQRVKKQRELEANDFYDSDDDNFLDRTGSVEKKRQKRKKWAGKDENNTKVDTYETLKIELSKKDSILKSLEDKLVLANEAEKNDADGDSLDDFMDSMKHRLDKPSKMKLRREIVEMKKEREKLHKLVEKLKPALPAVNIQNIEQPNNVVETTVKVVARKPHEDAQKKEHIEDNTSTKQENSEEKVKEIQKDLLKRPVAKESLTEVPKVKKKRIYGAVKKPDRKTMEKEEEVATWMPPQGQTGDGRTHLNDKLGY